LPDALVDRASLLQVTIRVPRLFHIPVFEVAQHTADSFLEMMPTVGGNVMPVAEVESGEETKRFAL